MEKYVLLVISTFVGAITSQAVSTRKPYFDDLLLDGTFLCEGDKRKISQNQIYRVEVSEENPPFDNCSVTFEAEPIGNCSGSCYLFVPNAFIKSSEIALTIDNGFQPVTFTSDNPILRGPQCSNESVIKMSFRPMLGYQYNLKERAFHFTLEIYNKCGAKGSVRNIKFEEAIKHVIGYHIDGVRKKQERITYIAGILLGCTLASCFLVIFAVAYSYNRCNPNRAPSRSVGFPLSFFKRKMKKRRSVDKQKEAEAVRNKPQEAGSSNGGTKSMDGNIII